MSPNYHKNRRRDVTSEQIVFIEIDVAKAGIVVSAIPALERFTVASDERGMRTLVERLRPMHPQLIVLEDTGGYELLSVAANGATRKRCAVTQRTAPHRL